MRARSNTATPLGLVLILLASLGSANGARADTVQSGLDETGDVLTCAGGDCFVSHESGDFVDVEASRFHYEDFTITLIVQQRRMNSLSQPNFYISLDGSGAPDFEVVTVRGYESFIWDHRGSDYTETDCDTATAWSDAGVAVSFSASCLGSPPRIYPAVLSAHSDGTYSWWDWAPSAGNGFWEDTQYAPRAYYPPVAPSPQARDYREVCDGAPAGAFSDTKGSVHEPAIDCVAAYGIAAGKTNGTFAPHETLSRGQIATFLVRMLEVAGVAIPERDEVDDYYSDDNGTTHEHSLNVLADFGVLPTADTRIQPAQLVFRAEMVVLTELALIAAGVPHPTATPNFFWDDEGHPLEVAINDMATLGITTGSGGGRFEPAKTLTRDQMATFLARSLQVLYSE